MVAIEKPHHTAKGKVMPFYKFNSVNDLHRIASRLCVPAIVDHIEYHDPAMIGRLAGKHVTVSVEYTSDYKPELSDTGLSFCSSWSEEWQVLVNNQPAVTYYQHHRGGLGF